MRKILLAVLVVLLLLLGGYLVINKLQIGSIEIQGIKGIQSESQKLNTKISEASKLTSSDYQTELTNLNKSLKSLQKEKETYEDIVLLSNSDEVSPTVKFEKYEIEYIWTKIGNHATSEGVVMKLDITKGSSNTQGLYDLKFTVTGDYIGITDFIYDIENDTSLGFKIEDFKMIPGENENNSEDDVEELIATFTCKDINVNIDETALSLQDSNIDVNTENNEQNNNTNTTQGNNSSTTNNNSTNNTNNVDNTNTTR